MPVYLSWLWVGTALWVRLVADGGLGDCAGGTQLALLAIARSPLILGANLTLLDSATLGLLTHPDVLRMNQSSTHSAQVLQEGDLRVWRADIPGGEKAIALFNLGETEMDLTKQLAEFGKDLGGQDWAVRNIWGGVAIPGHEFVERVPPHGCVLLELQ